jgi:hypothetical protein
VRLGPGTSRERGGHAAAGGVKPASGVGDPAQQREGLREQLALVFL